MFTEGLVRLYLESPDEFWRFFFGFAPGFVICVLYGLLLQSREFHGKRNSGWKMFRFILIVNGVSLLWTYIISSWSISSMTVGEATLVFILYGFLYMFPILGGTMTGMYLMKSYWFVKRTIVGLRTPTS